MSDLDDDLLALAGAGSEEEEEQQQVGIDEAESDSDVPLKGKTRKRKVEEEDEGDDIEEDEEDEEEEEEEEEELINPYPLEGKYKDEEDQENLLDLDEMEREQILFERSQEMEKFNERKYLKQRMKQQKQKTIGKIGEIKATRSSKRNKTSGGNAKLDKLSELRKQREQRTTRSRRGDDDFEDDDEDEEEDDDDVEENNDDDDEDEYGEEAVIWGKSSSSSTTTKTKNYEIVKYEDINKVKVGRSILHKYCFYSDFQDSIIETYGKINLGLDKRTRNPIYRMVQIINLKHYPEKSYQTPNFKCDIFIVVSQNKQQIKEFPINIFSDSPITREEFDRYKVELNKTGESLPYVEEINEKYQQLNTLMNRGISDKDVNEMIERKQKLQGNIQGFDAVFQKTRLLDQLKIVKQNNKIKGKNNEEITKIINKIKALDEILISQTKKTNKSESLNTMSKVNERNRKLNQTNIRKAEIKSHNARKLIDKDEAGGDPFSRLKTQTKVFYQDLLKQENEKAINEAKLNLEKNLQDKAILENKIATSTYRILGNMDKLINEIDVKIEI